MGHFHGDLVVRDEDELRFLGHRRHHLRVTFRVCVVQRRIHLVQQAERRRIQLEDTKDQRNGGQCLLTP